MYYSGQDHSIPRYDVGCIPCLLYPASGGSIDWALGMITYLHIIHIPMTLLLQGVAEIPYSMAMELRDNQGWAPDPSQIIPEVCVIIKIRSQDTDLF